MIRTSFLILIIIGCSTSVFTQSLEIGVWSGLGTYDLSSLRKIASQNIDQESSPRLETLDSYTIHTNFGVEVRKVYTNFSVGSFFSECLSHSLNSD